MDLAVHPIRTIPELVASRPCEVWSYHATALRGPARGIWYRLFLMLDVHSRYCPGWMVVPDERADTVADWIAQVVASQGPIPAGTLTIPAGTLTIPAGTLTIHADRGSSMTSKTVAELLSDLRIGRTHSRPHVCLLTG